MFSGRLVWLNLKLFQRQQDVILSIDQNVALQLFMPKRKTTQKKYQQESQDQHSRDPNMTRTIKKSSNQQKKNAGRPAKNISNQRIVLQENANQGEDSQELEVQQQFQDNKPDMLIMQAWLDFFHNVGQNKGLVMTESERQKLRAKELKSTYPKVSWSPRHLWSKENEINKIISIGQRCRLDMQDPKNHELHELLLGVSSIFAQQFTEEMYRMLLNVYLIALDKLLIQERSQKAILKHQKSLQEHIQEEQSPENMINNSTLRESKDNRTTSVDEENKRERLKELAITICHNLNGQYYLLSFRFKESIKKNEESVDNTTKEKAYEMLIDKTYEVIRDRILSLQKS